MLAYQVWECTRSLPAQPCAMARSTPRVRRAGLAPASSPRSAYDEVPGSSRGAPKACTRVSGPSGIARSARTSSATCTPAPP